MSTFSFNGISSDELGLIITKPIIRPTWAQEIELTAIPGRPRQMPYFKKYYKNADLPIEATIIDGTVERIRTLYSTLHGYGILSISTAAGELINAFVHLPVPESKALYTAELPIIFECEPFAYAVTETEQDITEADPYAVVNNGGSVFCDPQIVIIPSAAQSSVNCNGKTMAINTPSEIVNSGYSDTYSLTIDCEGELAYFTRPNGEKVACTECTVGAFPRLHTGDNFFICNGVESATIKYRERWL